MDKCRHLGEIFADQKNVNWVKASYGNVPEGALVGGSDHGEVLYIVRCEHNGHLIPGKLNPTHDHAHYPWNGEEHKAHFYEVLVIKEEKVEWIALSEGFPSCLQNSAIVGGFDNEEPLYIGRRLHLDSGLCVGKIHPSHKTLYISYAGKEIGYDNFEALCKK